MFGYCRLYVVVNYREYLVRWSMWRDVAGDKLWDIFGYICSDVARDMLWRCFWICGGMLLGISSGMP